MARRYFVKNCKQKSLLFLSVVLLAILAVAGSSCDPKQSAPQAPASVIKKPEHSLSIQESDLGPVFDNICRGNFELAQQLLDNASQSPVTEQLTSLLERYDKTQERREQGRQAAWQEQIDELETIQETISAKEAPDVNDIDEAMLAVVRAREFADEDKKDEVLNDPFVQEMLDHMKSASEQDEQQGKWIDAYAHCYYWLVALYEDNSTYQDKVEELTELAAIELSLKDSSCGETAIERYEGIQAIMYLRALDLLNNNYVSQIDCGEMVTKALERCRLLGIVLERTNEELPWTASSENVAKWNEGLEILQAQVDLQKQTSEPFKVNILAATLDDVLALNSVTLELPEEVLIAHFAEASFNALDPFTSLVWPWNVKDFEKNMTQQFTGIGVEISKATGIPRARQTTGRYLDLQHLLCRGYVHQVVVRVHVLFPQTV
jgi:hypothetical protein